MKILLTGMTSLQANGRRNDDYAGPFQMLASALPERGHEVDWREVVAGEELSPRYDLALVGINCVNGIGTMRYKYGATWAATQLPHAVVVDDCQWYEIYKSMGRANGYWKCSQMDQSQMWRWEAAAKHSKVIDRQRDLWSRGYDCALLTFFPWGDRSILYDKHPVRVPLEWDPSALVPQYLERTARPRELRWVCAALGNKDAFVDSFDLEWPVIRQYKPWIGEKKVKGAVKWRIPESEVVDLYASSWGALNYVHRQTAGSGWWRVRFNLCLEQAGCIMAGNAEECAPLGGAFAFTPEEIEETSDAGLAQIADLQHTQFVRHRISRETTLDVVEAHLGRILEESCPIARL